jgi:hypothetical protein
VRTAPSPRERTDRSRRGTVHERWNGEPRRETLESPEATAAAAPALELVAIAVLVLGLFVAAAFF